MYGLLNWIVTYIGPAVKAMLKCLLTIIIGIIIILCCYVYMTNKLFTEQYRKASVINPEQMYDYTDR